MYLFDEITIIKTEISTLAIRIQLRTCFQRHSQRILSIGFVRAVFQT